jgi:two-component system, LytTR family, response regulator
MIRAFLVDDEPLAVSRLSRLLTETGRVEVAGSSNDPIDAIAWLSSNTVDAVFLDINMPGMNGFEMLRMLEPQPNIVFTTAYDHFALEAFRASSIDYLVKPVDQEQLERALGKLERLSGPREDTGDLLKRLEAVLSGQTHSQRPRYPERIASRVGDRILFLDLPRVTHFFAEDKLTFAVVKGKPHIVDHTIADLEQKLDPGKFCRIHRSTLLNLAWVAEMDSLVVRLRDEGRTELVVARDRVRGLRERLEH